MKSNSVGTKLIVDGKTVGGLTSINGIDINADSIDVSDLSNTTGYKEKLPGWKDVSDLTASGFMDGEDEGQDELYTLLASGNVVDCSIVLPAKIGKTWSFKAGVIRFSTSIDVNDAVKFDMTLAVSGQPVLAATQQAQGNG